MTIGKAMNKGIVFSWAEDANGRMVHVDDVPRGLLCGCVCPHCREKLLARHGNVKEHGFAHHSDDRGANLKICYMVTLYKLAEHIIKAKKRIHAPGYYGIYRESDIAFADVKIDDRFKREDKQPDVIATTHDNKQYLIEFLFEHKVQHKRPLDYKNLTCLEVDLSGQTLETLGRFLLESPQNRTWVNNENYFNGIEEVYRNKGKQVKVVPETDCFKCDLQYSCCAIMRPNIGFPSPIIIENSGRKYRLCKAELYNEKLEIREQKRLQEKQRRKEEAELRKTEMEEREERRRLTSLNVDTDQADSPDPQEISCFNCANNLAWLNRDDYAHCGCFRSVKLPRQRVNPEHAEECKGFRRK